MAERDELQQRLVQALDGHFSGSLQVAASRAATVLKVLDDFWPDHYVIFTKDGWTVEHSFACRLSGEMATCAYHRAIDLIAGDDGAPDPDDIGRWRITGIDSEGLPSLEAAPGVTRSSAEAPVVPQEGTPMVVEMLRRHVMDWGSCDHPTDCDCSHAVALRFFADGPIR